MSDLTEHFSVKELTDSQKAVDLGIRNVPTDEALYQLAKTAQMLERIRAKLGGVPMTVTSGYRCPDLNRAVGGKKGSDHAKGMAADFIAPRFGTPYQIASELAPHVSVLGIGQLILEQVAGKTWVHVSIDEVANPINRIITISDAGPVPGIVDFTDGDDSA